MAGSGIGIAAIGAPLRNGALFALRARFFHLAGIFDSSFSASARFDKNAGAGATFDKNTSISLTADTEA
jgi:hypothetical protein